MLLDFLTGYRKPVTLFAKKRGRRSSEGQSGNGRSSTVATARAVLDWCISLARVVRAFRHASSSYLCESALDLEAEVPRFENAAKDARVSEIGPRTPGLKATTVTASYGTALNPPLKEKSVAEHRPAGLFYQQGLRRARRYWRALLLPISCNVHPFHHI